MSALRDIVAIDGPAGAGKSTIARRVAEALGYAFLDTGAMYRAATWWALNQNTDMEDAAALAAAVRAMPLEVRETGGNQLVLVNGQDVTAAIRTPEVTRSISMLDRNPAVRKYLVELQRAAGARGPTVAEGRDMGTVVFPHARCKVYLDASLEARARRRAGEFAEKGINMTLEAIEEDIRIRDEKDQTRHIAPLRKAEDATVVDTTHMSPDEVVRAIVALARASQ